MSEEMTRKEVIDWLFRLKSHVSTFMPKIWHEKFIKALQFAIASLKTDEAYQLEYENRDCVEVVRCKDCISREAVLNLFNKSDDYRWETTLIKKKIEKIPPVTPQEPKMGHWVHGEYCSECGCDVPAYIIDWKWQKDMDAKFCPNCGAKMIEPQESEYNNADMRKAADETN